MEANLEPIPNVCCHGRGMLQWDLKKVKPKRGEQGQRLGQDLGGSAGGAEEAADSRARDCHFDSNGVVVDLCSPLVSI